jgi:thiol-disulfide isomerase/thioredoxin
MLSIAGTIPRQFSLLKSLCIAILLFGGVTAGADDYAYDPDADPGATYQQAIAQAGQQGKLVLMVFGSEWCPDCRSLNEKMGQPPLSETVQQNFIVAHVDIGNWDKNMAFTEQFGEPVAKGIPSIAIVDADKNLLYVSEAGEFASARSTDLGTLDSWLRDTLATVRAQ